MTTRRRDRAARRWIAVALLLLLGPASTLVAVPGPSKRWIRLDSAHFTFFSSATERSTRALARDLEELRSALEILLPGVELRSPVPTWIYVFEDRIDFAPYRPIYEGRIEELDGYFLPHDHGNYVALDGDTRTNPRRTIFHEYLHEVERRNLTGLPLWFAEGLAELYSTFSIQADGSGVVGLPPRSRAFLVRRQPLMPLAELFALDHGDRDYHRGALRDLFYAQSWALVHYLVLGETRRERTQAYLETLARGEDAGDAFARMVEDEEALLAELRRYVRGRYTVRTAPAVAASRETAELVVGEMAYPDVLFRLGDLLAHGVEDHAPAAVEHFRAALEVDPRHAPSIAGLGFVADRAGDLSRAVEHYRRAAEAAPADPRLAYLHGQGLLRSLGIASLTPGTTTPAQLRTIRRARQALERSTSLDPTFGEAWADLGFTFAVEASPPPVAAEALMRALELLPERLDVAFNLFLVLSRLGDRQRAQALFDQVLEPSADPKVIAEASKGLLNLDIAEANALVDAGAYGLLLPVLDRILARAEDPAVIAQARRQRETLLRAGSSARPSQPAPPAPEDREADRFRRAARLAAAGDLRAARALLEELADELPEGGLRDEALDLLAVIASQEDGGRR